MGDLTENFSKREVACRCGCGGLPNMDALNLLQKLRANAGFPFQISSGLRCEDHNSRVGGSPNSQHVKGYAFDIRLHKSKAEKRYKLMVEVAKLVDADNNNLVTEFEIADKHLHIGFLATGRNRLIWGKSS